ncbi:MAG: ABC transporter substrate-binding protein [Acetatifactor sp.]|nr:ABC transporter substrate-binding protein [Acetatifactor sp.]
MHKKKTRLLSMICVGVLAVGLLAGCGRQGENVESLGESPENQSEMAGDLGESDVSVAQEETWEPVDWMQGGFQMPLYPIGYRECSIANTYVLDIPEPEFAYAKRDWRFYTSLGGDFYVLDRYAMDEARDENSQYRYQLYWLDGDTGESRVITPFWEEQGMNEWVWQVDAVSDHQLAFLSGAAWLESGIKAMFWDLESGETCIWDITCDLPEDYHRFWMDAQGYVYVSGVGNTPGLYVLGEKDTPGEMELLRTIEVEEPGRLGLCCRMPDGTPLVHMDGKLVYVDMDAGGVKELASVVSFAFEEGCIDERGLLYQNWNSQINVWNPATGDYNFMVILKEYGVSWPRSESLRIGVNKAGELMALVEKDGEWMVCCFGPKTEETEGTLRLANLWYNDSDVKIAAASYSAQHSDCQIVYEADWGNQEGFYERTMAQMAVGQGPDILFVSGEDMDRLSAGGLLADLSNVLEEDTCRQLFSGVMTAGIRDGKLEGLPTAVSGVSMVTVEDNWQGDTWTLSEAAALWRQRKGQGAWRFLPQRWSREEMLEYLVLSDMSNSPFVDWESGTCDFESDLFRQVLEMIGDRPVLEHTNLDIDEEYETARQVMEGVYLADVMYGLDIVQYTDVMDYYGDNAHLVGFPTESGNGNMLRCYGFMVVNAQTEHWEEVVDFLRYMYSKEFQSDNPEYLLRKDVLRENMAPGAEGEKYETFTLTGRQVPLRRDGSSYIEDYIAFMDSCRAERRNTEAIKNIIREEAESYFNNAQDLDNAARVIQSRVSIYLAENR